jgi:DNA-binding protein H-NS
VAAAGNIKTMPINKLFDLKAQVEAALASKVTAERRDLETRLAQLSRLDSPPRGRGRPPGRRGGAYGPVAPKYRNPANPSETWAGRGLKPRWLTAALKGGKKLEDFAIAATASAKKMPRKTSKVRARK